MIDADRAEMIKTWLHQAHSSFLQDLLQYVEQLEADNERLRARCQRMEAWVLNTYPQDWDEFEAQGVAEL